MSTNRIISCTAMIIDRVARDISPAVKPGFVWRLMYVDEPLYWIHNLGYTKGEKMSTTAVPYMTVMWLEDKRAGAYPVRLVIKDQFDPMPLRYLDEAVFDAYDGYLPNVLLDPTTQDKVYPVEFEIGFYADVDAYDIAYEPMTYHYYVGLDCDGVYDIFIADSLTPQKQVLPRVADIFGRFCERDVEKPRLKLTRDVTAYMYMAALYNAIYEGVVEPTDNFARALVFGIAQEVTVYTVTGNLSVPDKLARVEMEERHIQLFITREGYAGAFTDQISQVYETITLEKTFTLEQAETAVKNYGRKLATMLERCYTGESITVWYPQNLPSIEWGERLSKANKIRSKYESLLNELEILGLDPRKRGNALKIIYNDPDPVRAIETILIKLVGFNPETARQAAIRLCQKHAKACMPW